MQDPSVEAVQKVPLKYHQEVYAMLVPMIVSLILKKESLFMLSTKVPT